MIHRLTPTEIRQLEDLVLGLGALLSETDENVIRGTLIEMHGSAMATGQPPILVDYLGKLAALDGTDRDTALVALMRSIRKMVDAGQVDL